MTYSTILCQIEDRIATVTLNRPEARNALNLALLRELDQCIGELRNDPQVRVVLITGTGDKAFAAGADLKEFAATNRETGEALALHAQGVFARIERCGKPVIACINGVALGGGCELALACTLRLAADSAKLGQPEIKLGIVPGYGGTQRLPRLIGPSAALKLILTGDPISAQEALRLGLVDEVVPANELLARARELASMIIAQPAFAISRALDLVHRGADLPLDEALALEAKTLGELCATEDKAEGVTAFLEKRKPVWSKP